MYERYERLFGILNEYLRGFSEQGWNENEAERFLSVLEEDGDTPFDTARSVFDCGRYEACALVLAAFTASCESHGELLSGFGCGNAAITPEAVSAIFFGCSDIMPFYESLAEGTALDRLFDGTKPYANAQMRLKSDIASYLFTGALYDPCFAVRETEEAYIPLESAESAVRELTAIITGSDPAQPSVICVSGEKGVGRHTAIYRALETLNRRYIPVTLPASLSADRTEELCTKLLLSGSVPVISFCGEDTFSAELVGKIADEVGMTAVICGDEDTRAIAVESYTVKVGLPALEEQLILWQTMSREYSLAPDADLAELTGEFELTPAAVKKALRCASLLAGSRTLTMGDIKNGCYRSFGADMGSKAVRINSVFDWDDLVLPAHSKELLQAACDQVRLRHKVFDGWGFGRKMPYGKSVSMIFTGSPGTGKTMAAQIVAKELGMDIYRISLANVVSKYIGETEKNLNEIFDNAKQSHVILFFDEADALFSRRTEVKDSNDKYSNMEAAFLLQKIEEFSGVVILATNLVQNFDEAFKRRMRFIIDFPFPDADRRRELWKRAFPKKAPLGNIDFEFLVSHYELSGSNIRNIALHSAFLAASGTEEPIGMKHIMAALRNEYAKSGKAFTRAEAGEYYSCLTEN